MAGPLRPDEERRLTLADAAAYLLFLLVLLAMILIPDGR